MTDAERSTRSSFTRNWLGCVRLAMERINEWVEVWLTLDDRSRAIFRLEHMHPFFLVDPVLDERRCSISSRGASVVTAPMWMAFVATYQTGLVVDEAWKIAQHVMHNGECEITRPEAEAWTIATVVSMHGIVCEDQRIIYDAYHVPRDGSLLTVAFSPKSVISYRVFRIEQ